MTGLFVAIFETKAHIRSVVTRFDSHGMTLTCLFMLRFKATLCFGEITGIENSSCFFKCSAVRQERGAIVRVNSTHVILLKNLHAKKHPKNFAPQSPLLPDLETGK